jgi:hypothetical protein
MNILLLVFLLCALPYVDSFAAEERVVRSFSLSDMGFPDQVALDSRNNEHHFYFPMPQGEVPRNARIEVRGKYFDAFNDRAILTLLVNGEPVSKRELNFGGVEFSLKMSGMKGQSYVGRGGQNGQTFYFSVPLKGIQSKGGFLDLGVALSAEYDASHCVEIKGRGDALLIDARATGLTYSFVPSDVRDIRTLLTTLPNNTTILIPPGQLNAVQYGSALRLSLGLEHQGRRVGFLALPQVGDVVQTVGLKGVGMWSQIPYSSGIRSAAYRGAPFKLGRKEEVAAWLVARALSQEGLSQFVVDSAAVKQALGVVFQGYPMSSALVRKIGRPESWLQEATSPEENLRLARLGAQPVLLVEDEKAASWASTLWQALGDTPALALAAAEPLEKAGRGSFHFVKEASAQALTSAHEWQIPLKLSDFPNGKWPDYFELNLRATPVSDGQVPIASVLLNDNLLTVRALYTDGSITRVAAQVPGYAVRDDNVLKVQVNRSSKESACLYNGEYAPVQLLPSSFVNYRNAPDPTRLFMMKPMLAKQGQVVIPARYLAEAQQTLPMVSKVMRGFSIGSSGFELEVAEKAEFEPERAFLSFETEPAGASELVTTKNGRLILKDGREEVVFDSKGMGALLVAQLVDSSSEPGVYITSVGQMPELKTSPAFGAGTLAIADATGMKLEVALDDSEFDYQLDEENRTPMMVLQRYRIWVILLGLLIAPVLLVFGLRYYYRFRSRQAT